MSALAVPYHIQNHAAALAEGLSYGDRIYIGVCCNHRTDNAVFLRFMRNKQGIIISTHGRNGGMSGIIELLWGDIIELRLLEEKPNIYYSDVPEVADILKKLKASIQKCVETENDAGVLNLLDQVVEVKKAEQLFKEAREIIATVQW
mgnify:CR=1 FL=1